MSKIRRSEDPKIRRSQDRAAYKEGGGGYGRKYRIPSN
jgi:hypothetical protein